MSKPKLTKSCRAEEEEEEEEDDDERENLLLPYNQDTSFRIMAKLGV